MQLAPDLDLLAVEVAARPADLPAEIAWTTALPDAIEGLVVANEWLDNIPCHVVQMGDNGVARMVHVDACTGRESLGHRVDHDAVPTTIGSWLDRWWRLDPAEPGTRAEVGSSRDAAWAGVVRRVSRGLAVAIDYGHTRQARPPFGSLRSYRDGGEVDGAARRFARRDRPRRGGCGRRPRGRDRAQPAGGTPPARPVGCAS